MIIWCTTNINSWIHLQSQISSKSHNNCTINRQGRSSVNYINNKKRLTNLVAVTKYRLHEHNKGIPYGTPLTPHYMIWCKWWCKNTVYHITDDSCYTNCWWLLLCITNHWKGTFPAHKRKQAYNFGIISLKLTRRITMVTYQFFCRDDQVWGEQDPAYLVCWLPWWFWLYQAYQSHPFGSTAVLK